MTFSRLALATVVAWCACAMGTVRAADMTLVEKGISKAPIILPENATTETARAANALAGYIEKISGAKPAVLTGAPEQVPASAIWVGMQPKAAELFKGANLTLEKPEEILILCNGQHLLIAGRDRMVGSAQMEYGTANAVYTFIEKHLDVRWLWPGALGEDIVRRETITIAPVEYRFNPPFLQRGVYPRAGGALLDWNRYQRNQLDSLQLSIGHAFSDWWEKYHKDHPDYFALQPDGSRSGFTSPHTAKLCETNPKVWAQWLANAEEQLKQDGTKTVINAAPNDGSNSGLCVCDACRAWDHPEGKTWRYSWKGRSEERPAVTDRYVKFWNELARMLKVRYPDRELYVSGFAYGPAKPAPIAAKLEENIIIAYVGHFPVGGDASRQAEKAEWAQWAEKAPRLMFRPNLFWYSGGHLALPIVVTRNTIEDFRFLAEHNCVGLTVDGTPRHWAAQGPQYYLMAQLAWDPTQDGAALLKDYYRRGFSDAAEDVEAYFDYMESIVNAFHNRGTWRHSMGAQVQAIEAFQEYYSDEVFAKAEAFLQKAAERVAAGPEIYRERVAFVRSGLDFSRLQVQLMRVMNRVRDSKGKDAEAVKAAFELCEKRDTFFGRYDGIAHDVWFKSYIQNRSVGRGLTVQDYVGPPARETLLASGIQKVYRWTGQTGNALWSTPGNWQVQEGKGWAASSVPPGAGDHVVLGDGTRTDAPQRIDLDRNTTVGRIIVAATGAKRSYAIASRMDAEGDMLDADSGMLYTLRLADAIPLEQTPEATQGLALQVSTIFTHDGVHTIRLMGAPSARISIERSFKSEKNLIALGSGKERSGTLELRERITTPRLVLSGGANLLLNYTGTVLTGGFQGVSGTVLVQRDAIITGGMPQFSGTVVFRAQGTGEKDVRVTVNDISRNGAIHLKAPLDGSTGRLIFRVADIYSRAGGGNAQAPALHLDANTFIELAGDQDSPSAASRSAGIHGEGGLIVVREGFRRARPVTVINDRNTYTGGTLVKEGTLRLGQVTIPVDATVGGTRQEAFAGQIGPGALTVAAGATFDCNGFPQTVASLHGEGTVLLNGGTLEITNPGSSAFKGTIKGPGTLIEAQTKRTLGQ